MLRETRGPVALVRGLDGGEAVILAHLAEEGLDALRNRLKCECVMADDGWWSCGVVYDEAGGATTFDIAPSVLFALRILRRAGELECDPENPRRVRFIEP